MSGEKDDDKGGKVHEIRRKDQGKLPGIVPPSLQRLEDIEDELKEVAGKIAKLRTQQRELSDEAVSICETEKVKGTRIRGSDEWYVDEGVKKYKHRRFKDSKEKVGPKKATG